jgi:DNA-directed RNA polymerase beta' subunit
MIGWTIQAYDKVDKKTFAMWNVSEIIVEAETEEEALKKAKEIIKRNGYRVSKAWEKTDDQRLHEDQMMTQLEIQAKMLKLLR